MTYFSVSSLPARHGDCLWVEYGNEEEPNIVLIDAGPSLSDQLVSRLKSLKARNGVLELVVVTHIDEDHIGGMIKLLDKNFFDVPVKDFWFNGFHHLPEHDESFGPKQADKLTALIVEKQLPWNLAFDEGPIIIDDTAEPHIVELDGDAKVRILSPDSTQLGRLRPVWESVCGEVGLLEDILKLEVQADDQDEAFGIGTPDIPGLLQASFVEDTTEANGSSIAFIFEHAGEQVLFGADAYPSRLIKSLDNVSKAPHKFALVKLPHHGSQKNVSDDLIASLDCPVYLFSSNGAKFKHPSPVAVARVIAGGDAPTIAFNYRSQFNEIWEDPLLAPFSFKTLYGGEDGIEIILK